MGAAASHFTVSWKQNIRQIVSRWRMFSVHAECILSGEFAKGDNVTLVTNGTETATRVLDVIICSSSSPFETELSANIGKHKAGASVNAWIILDVTDGVQEGSVIYR